MPAPHLILPPPGSTPASRDSQGRPRSLPPDLLREASQRIGYFSLIGAGLWFLGPLLGHVAIRAQTPPGDTRWRSIILPMDAIAVTSIIMSLALFAYTRRNWTSTGPPAGSDRISTSAPRPAKRSRDFPAAPETRSSFAAPSLNA